MVTMYSKYAVHIFSNGNHFLTAWFLVYTSEHIRSVNLGMEGQSELLLCTLSILHT